MDIKAALWLIHEENMLILEYIYRKSGILSEDSIEAWKKETEETFKKALTDGD